MASIIFLDSPVCSGFSYARDPKGCGVGDHSSSLQVQTFLNKWFTHHPEYLANPFYLGGDSYAGKVIPLIAQYISQGTEKREQSLINLKDRHEIADAHVLYKKCVVATPKPIDDAIRRKFLLEESIEPNEAPGRPTVDCFTYGYYLAYVWINNNMTRDALGIKEGTVGEWVRCKNELPYTQDMPSSIPYHLNLTMRGYRALVYSGDHDLQVPQLSTQAWIRSLNFSIVNDWRAWHLDGQAAGFTIAYANNLAFATVKGGGHTAPEYQPEECFAMGRRWLDNKPL